MRTFIALIPLLAVVSASAPGALAPGLSLPPLHSIVKPLGAIKNIFPNISHTGSEMNFGLGSLAFATPPTLRLRSQCPLHVDTVICRRYFARTACFARRKEFAVGRIVLAKYLSDPSGMIFRRCQGWTIYLHDEIFYNFEGR